MSVGLIVYSRILYIRLRILHKSIDRRNSSFSNDDVPTADGVLVGVTRRRYETTLRLPSFCGSMNFSRLSTLLLSCPWKLTIYWLYSTCKWIIIRVYLVVNDTKEVFLNWNDHPIVTHHRPKKKMWYKLKGDERHPDNQVQPTYLVLEQKKPL